MPSMKQLTEAKEDNGVSKQTIFSVDPMRVTFEEGWNGRTPGPELDAHIERLKLAMMNGASMPPIKVVVEDDGTIVVRDGHCRTAAAQAIVKQGGTYSLSAEHFRGNDLDALLLMVGSGTGSLALTPLEAGRQYLRAINMGASVAQIADRLGVHRSTVENGLKLAEMPVAVQGMVSSGTVAAHTALKAVKAHGKDAAQVLRTAAADGKKVTPKKVAPGPGKRERGQTLPPVELISPEYLSSTKFIEAVEKAGFKIVKPGATIEDVIDAASQNLATLELPPLNPPIAVLAPTHPLHVLAQRLAAVDIALSKLPRDLIVELVNEARRLTQ